MDGGTPADLSGASCKGFFLRADGEVVMIDGSVDGNKLRVMLTSACYQVAGNLSAAMRLFIGGAIITVAVALLSVGKAQTDVVVGPYSTIPACLP
jgi:hypothetical protein